MIAVIAICIFYLLLRPRNKPQGAHAQQQQGSERQGARSAPSRGPAVSVSTVGTVLTYVDGQPQLLPGAAAALRRIAETTDIYLVTQLPEDLDALEEATLEALSSAGVFGAGACDRRKAMFCSTQDGRSAICRQLAPAVHIDTSAAVLTYLAPHLPRVVYVDAAGRQPEGITKGSLVVTRSLVDYSAAYGSPPA